jgi:hypothetical protein
MWPDLQRWLLNVRSLESLQIVFRRDANLDVKIPTFPCYLDASDKQLSYGVVKLFRDRVKRRSPVSPALRDL